MRSPASIAAAGLLFGAGLALSGMTDPARVLGFLDWAGDWDPTLAFVMAGAVGVHALGIRFVSQRGGTSRPSPSGSSGIDRRTIGGAVLFGVGWGLVGFCPGPALANLGALRLEAVGFVATLLLGMLTARGLFGVDRS